MYRASTGRRGLVVIKPSGVEYDELTPENLVVLDLDGNRVEGELNPSSDTKTHLELYKASPPWAASSTPHSPYAVAWGPGRAGHSLLRHHPRRLLLRCRALCPPPDQGGAGRGLREEHRQDHHRYLHRPGHRPGSGAGGHLPQPRSLHLGAKMRPRPSTTPWCWKRWRKWPC